MAEMFNSQIPFELQPEAQAISRQQKMAELLMSKGMQATPGQTVAGGVYVPTNPMENIANLFNAYAGSKGLENVEQQQLEMAKAIRLLGEEEVKNILEANKENPDKAMQFALNAQTSPGKLLANQLVKGLEPTTLEREYKAAKNDPINPFKGSINDFKNQMNEADKARIAQGWAAHNLALARFADETGGGYGAKPVQPTINQGSPILAKPGVSLAPNAPAYAQNSVTMQPLTQSTQTKQDPFAPLPPPDFVRSPKQQREWFAKQSEPLSGTAADKVAGAVNYQNALDNYKNILQSYTPADMANPNKRVALQEAYNTVVLTGKDAHSLGVLNGGDERILTGLAPNFNNPSSLLISTDAATKAANGQKQFASNVITNQYKVHQKPVPENLRPYVITEQPKETAQKSANTPLEFKTESEAAKAGIKKGTRVIINGVVGTWE